MSEQGGRYQRSFEGLIGAIIVTVLGVVAFVVFRSVFSEPPEQDAEEVDYLVETARLQEAGASGLVYPATLPDGWKATVVRLEPGERPRYELNFFTGDDEFVGLRLADEDADDLLAEAGVDDAEEGEPIDGPAGVAATFDAWADPDGDHAYTATVGDNTVLVYGSTSAGELADLVGRLSAETLTPPTPSPS